MRWRRFFFARSSPVVVYMCASACRCFGDGTRRRNGDRGHLYVEATRRQERYQKATERCSTQRHFCHALFFFAALLAARGSPAAFVRSPRRLILPFILRAQDRDCRHARLPFRGDTRMTPRHARSLRRLRRCHVSQMRRQRRYHSLLISFTQVSRRYFEARAVRVR